MENYKDEKAFLHLTGYQFAKIENVDETIQNLKKITKEICGTILVGTEGKKYSKV
jgi:predicted sulfurtransferase